MSETPQPGPAKRVKRVKTGCVTCRIRRVKCGEERPACKRCLDTGRNCDGYSNLAFSRRDLHAASTASSSSTPKQTADSPARSEGSSGNDTAPLARIVTDPAFSGVLEKRYFQFFRQRTVTSTNALMDSRFWDRVVLQFCHAEPAVKHAVLALTALHQISEAKNDLELALQHQAFADRYYQKALVAAKNLLASSSANDIDRVLVACLVFICYESIRGNYQAVHVHTGAGRAILQQHRARFRRLSRRNDLREIQQLFGRLDIAALAFSDESAPYPYRSEAFIGSNPNESPANFHSMDDARASLTDHVRLGMLLGSHIMNAASTGDDREIAKTESERLSLLEHLSVWYARFEHICTTAPNASPLLALTLRLWYQMLSLQLTVNFYGPETRYDAYISEFDSVVTCGEEIIAKLDETSNSGTFGFDLGLTIPLFLAVERCRDPQIRRRALAVMRAGARQEGAWESVGAADVIERWMLTEEADLIDVKTAADIPEFKRLHHIDSAVNTEKGVAQVVFSMKSMDGDSSRPPPIEVQERIAFESLRRAQDQQQRRNNHGLRPFSMSLDNAVEHRVAIHNNVDLYSQSASLSSQPSLRDLPFYNTSLTLMT